MINKRIFYFISFPILTCFRRDNHNSYPELATQNFPQYINCFKPPNDVRYLQSKIEIVLITPPTTGTTWVVAWYIWVICSARYLCIFAYYSFTTFSNINATSIKIYILAVHVFCNVLYLFFNFQNLDFNRLFFFRVTITLNMAGTILCVISFSAPVQGPDIYLMFHCSSQSHLRPHWHFYCP